MFVINFFCQKKTKKQNKTLLYWSEGFQPGVLEGNEYDI